MNIKTFKLIKNTVIYKQYLNRINELENNLTNRLPRKIGLTCRWISVSGKKDNTTINCHYMQFPDLQECIECYGLVFGNFRKIEWFEKQIDGLEKGAKERPQDKEIYESGIKMWEDKLIELLKSSIKEFLENVKNI